MRKICSIELQDGIAIVRFSARPDIADCKAVIKELAERDISRRGMVVFDPYGFEPSSDELEDLAHYSKTMLQKSSRFAMVSSTDLSYGLSRQYGSNRETSQVEPNAFRTEEDAIAWLNE